MSSVTRERTLIIVKPDGVQRGLIGPILSRFGAAGMTRAMVVAGVTQAVFAGIGMSTDVRGGILSMGFAGLWLIAAALFHNAAQEQQPALAEH